MRLQQLRVIFINVVRARFLYEIFGTKTSNTKHSFLIFGTKISNEKLASKTLMKLAANFRRKLQIVIFYL